ncbi:hypothetical protein EIP86_001902 [Pleurotus ostreatoroseus]|nr:hypothetical protein EIP86_001902 [Pleurotus ostreatoroseus]
MSGENRQQPAAQRSTQQEHRRRYKHILESPVRYVRGLKSRLVPDLAHFQALRKDRGWLTEVHAFLMYPDCLENEKLVEHKKVLKTMIELGLIDSLANFIFSEAYWIYTTDMIPTRSASLNWSEKMLASMPLAIVVESFLEVHNHNITKFFSQLWRQRRYLFVDSEKGGE